MRELVADARRQPLALECSSLQNATVCVRNDLTQHGAVSLRCTNQCVEGCDKRCGATATQPPAECFPQCFHGCVSVCAQQG